MKMESRNKRNNHNMYKIQNLLNFKRFRTFELNIFHFTLHTSTYYCTANIFPQYFLHL